MVAWCYDCFAIICQPCVTLHKKIASLGGHHVVGNKESRQPIVSKSSYCPRHCRVEPGVHNQPRLLREGV